MKGARGVCVDTVKKRLCRITQSQRFDIRDGPTSEPTGERRDVYVLRNETRLFISLTRLKRLLRAVRLDAAPSRNANRWTDGKQCDRDDNKRGAAEQQNV